MATIIKRKKAYSVVYNYVDENGETKQKWETVHTHKEALRRKAEVENTQNAGTFLPPNKQTVREFLHDFVATYGERKWSISMYDGQLSLISNYIRHPPWFRPHSPGQLFPLLPECSSPVYHRSRFQSDGRRQPDSGEPCAPRSC